MYDTQALQPPFPDEWDDAIEIASVLVPGTDPWSQAGRPLTAAAILYLISTTLQPLDSARLSGFVSGPHPEVAARLRSALAAGSTADYRLHPAVCEQFRKHLARLPHQARKVEWSVARSLARSVAGA